MTLKFEHDFKRFPEIRNDEMDQFLFMSPHPQILENLLVKVVKVHDGDSIRVEWDRRDFDFPVRLRNIDAPELDTKEGILSRDWLAERILGEHVYLNIHPRWIDWWGRLMAKVELGGIDIGEEMIMAGVAARWH